MINLFNQFQMKNVVTFLKNSCNISLIYFKIVYFLLNQENKKILKSLYTVCYLFWIGILFIRRMNHTNLIKIEII